ncbi:bestrophin-4-like [Bacillus rossius redtenbacheri]|uniref:bestrophin-4-like n=1 Tax=Bacillus rossius redtenbacheri TaxID=93214 RepID=UPI002FDD4D94
MTITYSAEVANSSPLGCFWKILCRWRGSVYKLIWRDFLAYIILYFVISLIYRYALNEPQQRVFEKIRMYFSQQSESIPMSFVLGFYVTLIVRRWWDQYRLLPWPDSLALFVSAAITGVDERGRLMRRNIVRYAMLSYVIALQKVSLRVKKRFPTYQHIVDAGIMMDSERKIFEMMEEKTNMSKYWMPLTWATNIINRARKEGLLGSDHLVQTILTELSDMRRRLGSLIGYDTVCVPLVYTQVVTLSVYMYFLSAVLGRQYLIQNSDTDALDMYFPFFTALQFCFYIGWLKVAEVLINPFGEDDDDIELNWLIDRHLKAAYMIVDEMHEEHPELLKDQYWDEVVPRDLPYTVASEHYRRSEPKGTGDLLKVKPHESTYANIFVGKKSHHCEDIYADYVSAPFPPAGSLKMNGAPAAGVRNRPRIPTPDVTKEVVDRERMAGMGSQHSQHSQHPATFIATTGADGSPAMMQVVLSTISEDSHGGAGGGASALAQSVLTPTLTGAGLDAPTAVISSQPFNISFKAAPFNLTTLPLALTPAQRRRADPPASPEEDSGLASEGDDRSRKTSTASETRRSEVYV